MFKNSTTYLVFIVFFCCLFVSCKPKETNWNRNYSYNSNEPLGTQLLYESLDKIFPNAKIRYYKNNKSLENILYNESYDSNRIIIIVANYFNPTENEIYDISNEIENGNTIFISANSFNDAFLRSIQMQSSIIDLKINDSIKLHFNQDYANVNVQIPENSLGSSINYSGIQPNIEINTFTEDTTLYEKTSSLYLKHTTLESPENTAKASYIALQSEYGAMYLHHNPDLLCNNFLLQNQNYDYLNAVFGFINTEPETVIFQSYLWSDTNSSDLKMLLQKPALKIAFTLIIIIALIYLLIEVKNKQRVIPIINKDENSTSAFVKTVGHLYYNYGSNKNIATKMTQFFLENVRSKYNIDTQLLDNVFVEKYHFKSGNSHKDIETFLMLHKQIINTSNVDSYLLFRYHSIIQKIST